MIRCTFCGSIIDLVTAEHHKCPAMEKSNKMAVFHNKYGLLAISSYNVHDCILSRDEVKPYCLISFDDGDDYEDEEARGWQQCGVFDSIEDALTHVKNSQRKYGWFENSDRYRVVDTNEFLDAIDALDEGEALMDAPKNLAREPA